MGGVGGVGRSLTPHTPHTPPTPHTSPTIREKSGFNVLGQRFLGLGGIVHAFNMQ